MNLPLRNGLHSPSRFRDLPRSFLSMTAIICLAFGVFARADPEAPIFAGQTISVRRETAVSNRWLAQRLHLGHVSQVSRAGAVELPIELQRLVSR